MKKDKKKHLNIIVLLLLSRWSWVFCILLWDRPLIKKDESFCFLLSGRPLINKLSLEIRGLGWGNTSFWLWWFSVKIREQMLVIGPIILFLSLRSNQLNNNNNNDHHHHHHQHPQSLDLWGIYLLHTHTQNPLFVDFFSDLLVEKFPGRNNII